MVEVVDVEEEEAVDADLVVVEVVVFVEGVLQEVGEEVASEAGVVVAEVSEEEGGFREFVFQLCLFKLTFLDTLNSILNAKSKPLLIVNYIDFYYWSMSRL